MTVIRWGILGTGAIAKAFAEAIQETEGDLIAVASNTKQRAEEFVKDYQCEPVEGYHNPVSYTHLTLPTKA